MADEIATIEAVAGPYAGQRLTMSRADADAAIADKWAIDPNAPPPKEGEEVKPPTDEERSEIRVKAEKAARKLRGEPEPEAAKEEPQTKPEAAHTRDMSAERPAPYATRTPPRK